MIVAVEGPSAAGKTTWCRATMERFVAEYVPNGQEPNGSDRAEQATYWAQVNAQVNAQRWTQALTLEESTGVAICDSDPLKLHYSWCLAAVGAEPVSRFEQELAAVRRMFAQRRLGFADVVLLSIPDPEQLVTQRDGDSTRRRGHFELHARLAEPLAEWYAAVNRVDPGRVLHGFPTGLDVATLIPPRPDRCNVQLLDQLIAELPELTS
ncbi:MAG: hypothetical protein EOP31_17030 [Rhodococcus sp. (in: high G+C Gram-positive bacteria)]|uniref:hypothetical protein n=1 Tax=Rhodococcus sp. TaxID=1831 RepID=UPI0012265753|nr:hypothetical protein [Rhodococcus sp. (in: high G+C Gram-positive bacteria)]RZL24142.1 MAG: hypothetical protein EOP31_17030 [Rhodococcus sp. (in: high G+C Gram-positive bacteria)]